SGNCGWPTCSKTQQAQKGGSGGDWKAAATLPAVQSMFQSGKKLGMRSLALFVLFLLLVASVTLFGQAVTGTILGAVKDPSGAVVVNAQVTITNTQTRLVRTVSTDTA